MQIDLKCTNCGGNRFDYPLVLRDDTIIACADCGHGAGTVADMQRKVVKALQAQAAAPAQTSEPSSS